MKGEKYLFVVSGPSGTGKDTVVAALLKKQAIYMDPTLSARAREIELKNLIAKYDI